MFLNSRNRIVLDTLKEKQLHYLVKPFIQLIELDQMKKIKIHKMTWKIIMQVIHNGSRADIEKNIMSYLIHFGIVVEKKKRVDKRVSRDRVKKHREYKKSLGYKTVTIQLSPVDYKLLKEYKERNNYTYSEALRELLHLLRIKK